MEKLSSCVVLTLGVSVGLWNEIGSLFGDIFLRQDAIYMARNDVESKQETLWSAWGDWLLDFAGLLPPTVSSYLSDPFPNHRSLLFLLSSSPSLSLCCSFSFSLSEPVIYLLVPLPCWLLWPFETLIWICLEWSLSICFPDKFPGSRDAEVLGPHFEKHCLDPFSILPEYNSKTALKNLN